MYLVFYLHSCFGIWRRWFVHRGWMDRRRDRRVWFCKRLMSFSGIIWTHRNGLFPFYAYLKKESHVHWKGHERIFIFGWTMPLNPGVSFHVTTRRNVNVTRFCVPRRFLNRIISVWLWLFLCLHVAVCCMRLFIKVFKTIYSVFHSAVSEKQVLWRIS